jgi:hypothetical protein
MPHEMSDEELADLYICTDRATPDDKIIEAALKAVEENPDNAPSRDNPGGVGIDPRGPVEMAVVIEKKWRPGRTLRCAFMDGIGSVQEKVEKVAKQWEEFANLKLQFVNDGDAEIRISFEKKGSWSYLGTDNLVIADTKPTMNFGWLKPTTSSTEYSRVVLHEFGHAFGCIHEHSHPEAGIPWDESKVFAYYQITNGWDEQKTRHNVLARYAADKTNFSAYDSTSIMQYSVPNELTIGDFSIGWNTVLSNTDKQFISTIYPGEQRQPGELRAGERVAADIGSRGEEDKYHFTCTTAGIHTLETHGRTDVVMALYGPDSTTRFLAFDDDSGKRRNAKLSRFLSPGTYHVRVRHYSRFRTGRYEIELRQGT